MRLAVVSPFIDRRHGTERALAELLERLARDYHCEIHLYAQSVQDLDVTHPPRVFPANTPGIFWHKVPIIAGPQLVQFLSWFCSNRLWRWAHRSFRGASFDVVLSPGINCTDAQIVLVHALFSRLRELLKEETASEHAGFLRRLHRRAYYGILASLEKCIYSDHTVTLAAVSPRTAKQLEKYFHRQEISVIPNGVDAVQFSPGRRLARRQLARAHRQLLDEDFVLLLVGNDWANKGVPAILEALAALSDIPAKLLVVGNDAPGPFQEMARSLNVLGRCIWEPATKDILDAYAAADLYVSPSREDSFGMPVAEAMACGLAVISSAFAGVSFYLNNNVDSFVVQDPLDSQSLSALIRKLFEQPEIRARVGQAAAKVTQDWTWDRNAAAVFQFLQEACARR